MVEEEIEDSSSVVVLGNAISWSDDGWYQVQGEAAHTEVCGGGHSCIIEPGTYVVINHSTGEQFNDIVVSSTPQSVDSLITLDSYEQLLRELITLINATPMTNTLNTQTTITDAGITFVAIHVEATLQVSIERDTAFTWQTGEVVAIAEDGSQLTPTPTIALQRTFNLALSGHDSVITRQWADGFEIFCGFTTIEACGSF